MSEKSPTPDSPSPAEVQKDIAYFKKEHGIETMVVTPIAVRVQRSNKSIESDWHAVAFSTKHNMYLVRKSDGTLKGVPAAELKSVNKELVLPVLSTPTMVPERGAAAPVASVILLGDQTREALVALGLGAESHAGYIEKFTAIAQVIADELQKTKPQLGAALLKKLLDASGTPFNRMTGGAQARAADTVRHIMTTSGVKSTITADAEAVMKAAEPYFKAILSKDFFIGITAGVGSQPALAHEMAMQLYVQVLERAYVAKMLEQ